MVEIRKLDERGKIVFSYEGRLINAGDGWSVVEAIFTREDVDAGYVVFRKGDRYLEWFYADRWYNIFELHDVSDDQLKGWYCNITHSATITAGLIAWSDLALDVFVTPTAEILIVDQDEFDALDLDPAIRAEAWRGVEALRDQVRRREAPFHQLPTPSTRP